MNQLNYPLIGAFTVFAVIAFVLFSQTAFRSSGSPITNQKPIPTVTPITKNIDFNKPVSCNLSTQEASYSARMDGDAVAVTITQQQVTRRIVVQGDCLYEWNAGESSGVKRCGMSSMISMGKQLASTGLVSFNSIIPGFSNPLEQCTNVRSVDSKEFIIPQTIRFVESQKAQ